MRSWLEVDNWFLRVSVTGRGYHWRTRKGLERKAEALRAEQHRHTAAGAREWDAAWRRYWQTVEDKRFQAFKNLVPGLVPPKRGRKPKTPGMRQAKKNAPGRVFLVTAGVVSPSAASPDRLSPPSP